MRIFAAGIGWCTELFELYCNKRYAPKIYVVTLDKGWRSVKGGTAVGGLFRGAAGGEAA